MIKLLNDAFWGHHFSTSSVLKFIEVEFAQERNKYSQVIQKWNSKIALALTYQVNKLSL